MKQGDVVRLITGGPEMVVLYMGSTLITCTWFAGIEQQLGSFPPTALVPKVRVAKEPPGQDLLQQEVE